MRNLILSILFVCVISGQQQQEQLVKFESTSNLVVVNVSVKDGSGKPIESLKPEDFGVFEDGKRMKISVFEFQQLSRDPLPDSPASTAAAPPTIATRPEPAAVAAVAPDAFKDRRLLVLFFDFSSMSQSDQIRSYTAARKFINQQLTTSDMVAIASYSAQLKVLQDFTQDRQLLLDVINRFEKTGSDTVTEKAGALQDSSAQKTAQGDANQLAAEDEEFNIFNTDRKLAALQEMAKQLGRYRERKALVYISSGVERTGMENESQLRSTINSAVRANVAFYPIDARGLVASAPAGDAGSRSGGGASLFSGGAVDQSRRQFIGQQDTLTALAADTGGKALLDSNDLSVGMRQAQQAVENYYVLGFYSPNVAPDGKFRKIRVELKSQPRAKLEYRPGYFPDKTFKQFDESEKERHLEEALALATPITDLPIAIEVNYFRLAKNRYFVPVAVKIPGSAITVLKKRGREEALFDFIGSVKNSKGSTVGTVRDSIRVKLASGQLSSRSLQYDTGFMLPPGDYSLKLLVRENQEGKMGTFLTHYVIPDVATELTGVRLSSVVWSGQREKLEAAVGTAGESRKRQELSPLVKDGQKVVPSVTRVFGPSQNLYVYFEVYDPGADPSVAASLSIYRGKELVFESQEVRLNQVPADRAQTIPFQIQLPLAKFAPGRYVAQLNVVDQAGKKFGYSRSPLVMTQ